MRAIIGAIIAILVFSSCEPKCPCIVERVVHKGGDIYWVLARDPKGNPLEITTNVHWHRGDTIPASEHANELE